MQSVCQKIGGTGPFDLHDRRPLQLSRNLSATARRSSTVSSFFSFGKFGSIIIKVYLCPVLRKTARDTMTDLSIYLHIISSDACADHLSLMGIADYQSRQRLLIYIGVSTSEE